VPMLVPDDSQKKAKTAVRHVFITT